MGDPDRAAEVFAAWYERGRAGATESADELCARYPDLATDLRAHLRALALVDEAFGVREEPAPPPERIGPYRIVRVLGTGGMGTVHLAQDGKGASVALKLLHPHLLHREGFFKRFLREAELGRRVVHDNVVRTLDVDALAVAGRTFHFLVMEYVEGQTLRELLDDVDRVPEELCRHVGREVAKALAAIHAVGAVHRDLKPENVLITMDHAVKVMDLGVARLAEESLRLSQTGAFVGSLVYAAPEQFRGGGGAVDARADLHALGVLLYELAAGRPPFGDDDARAVMRRILTEPPRRLGEICPQASAFFEEVVHTLLAKEPEKRFASAADVARLLEEGEGSSWWKEEARRIRATTRRPLRRIRIPRETALYGREADLAKLRALYEKAKAGEGSVLLVEGEAGIGKSRLVDEFVGLLQRDGEDLNFLFGSYPPGGAATASGAFSTAYREQFGDDGCAAYLPQTPLLVPAFDALLRGDVAPKDAESLTKDSLQTVFVHATRSLAAERPTIVVIEDLHFAPEEGRALFASLALAAPGHRILLVGTMRPGVPEGWRTQLERLGDTQRIELARLGIKDLVRLLEDALSSQHLAEELAVRIGVKSDGNPFFVFEILRGLKEGQFLAQRPDGTWHTTQVLRDIQVPSSIVDLVAARVGDLADEDRNLLDLAACCGFEFDAGLVADATLRPRVPVLQDLAKIEKRHRLVRSSGRRFVFDHHQVQEVLYAALPEPLREEYHAALGDALERRSGAAAADPEALDGALCVDLAEHFIRGARGPRALRYIDSALAHYDRAQLHEPAVALAERMLSTDGLLAGPTRAAVLVRLSAAGSPLDRLGRRPRQEEAAREAVRLAAAAGDEPLRCRALRALGTCLLAIACTEEAEAALLEALQIARTRGDRALEAAVVGNLGLVCVETSRLEEAWAHHERHLTLSRELGNERGEAVALENLGMVLAAQGRFVEAREVTEQGLAINRRIGDRDGETAATVNVGRIHYALGHGAEAREFLERGIALAREIGHRPFEAVASGVLGAATEGTGLLAEAREHHERHGVLSREIGNRPGEAIALVNLGPLWLTLGETARARAALEESLARCRALHARYPEGYALLGLSRVADAEGDHATAQSRALESLALRREIGHGDGVVESLIVLGELRRRAGDVERARDASEEAASLAREQARTSGLTHALALLACLADGERTAVRAATDSIARGGDSQVTRFLLWEATGDVAHLAEAKRHLDFLVEHAPAECRESMLANVRLHREITEAWTARSR